MRALIDTNIILDVLCQRERFFENSSMVFKYVVTIRKRQLRLSFFMQKKTVIPIPILQHFPLHPQSFIKK